MLGGTPSMPPWPLGRAAEGTLSSGRPKMLIMDVCGAYMRPVGGWFSVNGLVQLLLELGVDEQATRSAVSRMRRRGLLEPEQRDGVRGYRLTELSTAALPGADSRIFGPMTPASLADGWVFVAFSIPESDRDRRHQLRARLSWLNFGMVTHALWMAPRRRRDELEQSIRELGLESYVTVVVGHHEGFEDLGDLVRRCWDLDGLRALYREYLDEVGPALGRWRDGVGDRRREAFVDYTLAVHRWRKFPYIDPGLPTSLLPPDWEGGPAAEAFARICAQLQEPALDHVREVGLTR
jgi:phenylacetic acid degradation operon negative regulatory protein